MEEENQELDKPINGALWNLKITQSREEAKSMNKQRDLSCYYSLRKNPKKKSPKSPESMKKILFRCEECGKGFRYEKCLSNHQEVMHLSTNQRVYEESLKSLCSSFSLVRKKKRSRIIRYKKTSLSCSFTTFLESPSAFAANDEELEVAECLILLSKSNPKFVEELKLVAEAIDVNLETPKGSYDSGCLRNNKPRKAGEFESGVFSDEQELMEERVSSYETSKEKASFLGDDHKLDQQKQRKAGEFELGFLSNEQRLLREEITTHETFEESVSFLGHKCELDQQKLRKGGEFGTGFWSNEQKLMEETWKVSASFLGEKHELEQQKPRKAGDFESTFYSTELGVGAMECSDSDTGSEHQCKLCNKIFSSYQALGGHQTFHRMNKSKNKRNCREDSVEPEDESVRCSVTQEKKKHECSICSKKFRPVHALGGHKKCHSNWQETTLENRGR
ncbi:Zinc finger protein AZF2 [Cardamine amara subsp. amara]|uniref:Zinc finger protein AZF2 n=1 Tax=Cardamine amara subsp. amara TaxID=228776 RepID=A0ABD1AGL6_CARAN